MGGGRLMRQDVEHPLAFLNTAAGRKPDAQNALCSDVVHGRTEDESSGSLIDGPSGEEAGQLRDVLLGVAAIDAEGVELHDLAGVVFVEAALAGPVGTPRT